MPEHGTKHEQRRYIVIPNWEDHQHKDVWRKSGGRPPWIKTYTRLLLKDEYMDLTLAQRGLLHGIWLLYANAGQVVNEDTCRRLLCTNKGESRHLLDNLRALSDAGLIRIQSRPEEIRVEKKELLAREQPVDNPQPAPISKEVQAWQDELASLRAQRGGA